MTETRSLHVNGQITPVGTPKQIKKAAEAVAKKELADKTAAEKRFVDLNFELAGVKQNLDLERRRRQVALQEVGSSRRQVSGAYRVGGLLLGAAAVGWIVWRLLR